MAAEQRPGVDGGYERFECLYGAGGRVCAVGERDDRARGEFVGFGASYRDFGAVVGERDVGRVERDEFGSA